MVSLMLPGTFAQRQPKLPKPQPLGAGIRYERDPTTGELRQPREANKPAEAAAIRARVALVEIGCNVSAADGEALRGLTASDFRVFEGGAEQPIAHFDASTAPASIALIVDTSPSVLRDLEEMRDAARTLARHLAPQDEVAVVAFADSARLVLPFTADRVQLDQAIRSLRLPPEPLNARGSNIYQAVYLATQALFLGTEPRRGRKAVVLLTDGQDSGLGLSWDPASAAVHGNRLGFEDVSRMLGSVGVELYAVSTQPRPATMTEEWLATHRSQTLVTPQARELGIPHYTLYLAELVRRAGGRIYFLREMGTLSGVYRRIAESLGAQYTLGYYPSGSLFPPGWRTVRVELAPGSAAHASARLSYRFAYYVPVR